MSQKEMVDTHFLNEMTRSIVVILRGKGGQEAWEKTQHYYPNAPEINAALQNADSETWTEWAAELQRDESQ